MPTIPQDLAGRRFGYWSVLSRAPSDAHYNAYWNCICDCGAQRTVLQNRLLSGRSHSCGCLRSEAYRSEQDRACLGQRFGRLTVLRRGSLDRYAVYECRCDCGKEVTIRAALLLGSITQSCGCLARDMARARRLIGHGEAAFNALLIGYQTHAIQRGIQFNLTRDAFAALTRQPCYYCGAEPAQTKRARGGNYIYTGVDRVDSSGDYTPDNVVACCKRCNTAKSDMPQAEFLDLVRRIYQKHFDGSNTTDNR